MVEKEKRITIWYDELRGEEYHLVGKKNANLGEMISAGVRVSPGFALTVHANEVFVVETGIVGKLGSYLKNLGQINYEKSSDASKYAMDLIENAKIPQVITDEIFCDYEKLCGMTNVENTPVAVRSSGAVSMPGQMETYLNIRGKDDLLRYIKKTWSSAYSVEAITYRMNKGMGFMLNIGVGIPKMVNSRLSGVIFTLNPLNGDRSKISVDVSYGLGEAVVSGLVTPDNYLVEKITLQVINKMMGCKESMCVYQEDGSDIKIVDVAQEDRVRYCITQEELTELCRIAKAIDAYYGKPYDIEFAIDWDLPFPENVVILQVRPESVWSKKEAKPKAVKKKGVMDRLVGQLVTGVRMKK
jgi:pyruvate,water dikinase